MYPINNETETDMQNHIYRFIFHYLDLWFLESQVALGAVNNIGTYTFFFLFFFFPEESLNSQSIFIILPCLSDDHLSLLTKE